MKKFARTSKIRTNLPPLSESSRKPQKFAQTFPLYRKVQRKPHKLALTLSTKRFAQTSKVSANLVVRLRVRTSLALFSLFFFFVHPLTHAPPSPPARPHH